MWTIVINSLAYQYFIGTQLLLVLKSTSVSSHDYALTLLQALLWTMNNYGLSSTVLFKEGPSYLAQKLAGVEITLFTSWPNIEKSSFFQHAANLFRCCHQPLSLAFYFHSELFGLGKKHPRKEEEEHRVSGQRRAIVWKENVSECVCVCVCERERERERRLMRECEKEWMKLWKHHRVIVSMQICV